MSKNLVDNESFEFTEGAEREQFEEIAGKVDYLWNEDLPSQIQSLRSSIGGVYTTLNSQESRIRNSENNIAGLQGGLSQVTEKQNEDEESMREMGEDISGLQTDVDDLESQIADQNNSVLLYDGEADVGDTITLSEAFTNFRKLMFVDPHCASCVVYVGLEAKPADVADTGTTLYVLGRVGISMNGVYKFTNTNDLFNRFGRAIIHAPTETSITIAYGSGLMIGSSVAEVPFQKLTKIYGLQRIASDDVES